MIKLVIHTTKKVKVKHPLDGKLLVVVKQSLCSTGEELSSGHDEETDRSDGILVNYFL